MDRSGLHIVLPILKFLVTAAIWFFVIRLIIRKKESSQKSRAGEKDQRGLSPLPDAAGSGPDLSLWRKAAAELSGKVTSPFDKSGMGLAITGTIDSRPFRIEHRGENKIFYSLTLPYAPQVEVRTYPIRCVSDSAIIGGNSLFLLCSGTAPQAGVIRELAGHAKQILHTTIPFEDEAEEDRPESAFLRKRDTGIIASAPALKIQEPVLSGPGPAAIGPEPAAIELEPAAPAPPEKPAEPEPAPAESPAIPEPAVLMDQVQEAPAPAPAKPSEEEKADGLSPESLAEVLFRNTLPGPAEKEYFASLTGRRVEWTGKVRMAYEISSDFVFGREKGVKVQMDLCTVAGKYGRQTLRAVAVFPPENYGILRSSSNKTIRFRGTILKLEAFSREVYLSEGELL